MRSLVSANGNIDVIPCGTDIQGRFSSNKAAVRIESKVIFIYVGRFDQRKALKP